MSREDEVRLTKILMGPADNNCYILTFPELAQSIIVDTPSEPDTILNAVKGTHVQRIIITHSHQDHWGALQEVKARTGAPVSFHPAEEPTIGVKPDLPLGPNEGPATLWASHLTESAAIHPGEIVTLGPAQIRVIHTPGHTPGSICLLVGVHLITGDTLFPGGPGHTRTPEALQETIRSITQRLFTLPDDLQIWPGHGEGATLGQSKREYAIFASKPHDPGLCGDILWLES